MAGEGTTSEIHNVPVEAYGKVVVEVPIEGTVEADVQPGDAEGPGEGSSGAKVTKGTDIWYSFTPDIVANPFGMAINRTWTDRNSGEKQCPSTALAPSRVSGPSV